MVTVRQFFYFFLWISIEQLRKSIKKKCFFFKSAYDFLLLLYYIFMTLDTKIKIVVQSKIKHGDQSNFDSKFKNEQCQQILKWRSYNRLKQQNWFLDSRFYCEQYIYILYVVSAGGHYNIYNI